MGRYINLVESSADEKCLVLASRGAKLQTAIPAFVDIPEDKTLVCVGGNGPFQYVAVVYNEREYEEFTDDKHTEPQFWFLMDSIKVDELLQPS